MATALETGLLPKSRAGRSAKPIDQDLLKSIAAALKKNPTGELDGETRPALYGSSDAFASKGKATSDGRRYKIALEKAGTVVRVTALQDGSNWKWRVYLPLSTSEAVSE